MNKLYCIIIGLLLLSLIINTITKKENYRSTIKIIEKFNVDGEGDEGDDDDETVNYDPRHHIPRTDLERSAMAAAKAYCPVPVDYNPNDYMKKSEALSDEMCKAQCPVMPDMKDYVLKTSIPPQQQCPPCICPKVKVSAGLCQHTDCSLEQCQKKVKCPEVKPCDMGDVRVCPAIKIPNLEELEKRFNLTEYVSNLALKEDQESKNKLDEIRKILLLTQDDEYEDDALESFTNFNNENSPGLEIVNNKLNIDNLKNEVYNFNRLNKKLNNNNNELKVSEASPSQNHDSDCKQMKYTNNFDSYGLLGSLY